MWATSDSFKQNVADYMSDHLSAGRYEEIRTRVTQRYITHKSLPPCSNGSRLFTVRYELKRLLYWRLSFVLEGQKLITNIPNYRGADKSLARPTSRCILFDGMNISFDASLVIYCCIAREVSRIL
jgi:hypothetical protein